MLLDMVFQNADGEQISVRPKNKVITADLLNKKKDIIEKIINNAEILGINTAATTTMTSVAKPSNRLPPRTTAPSR